MIHYHVWFSLKPDVDESEQLDRTREFLRSLAARGLLDSFDVLRNTAATSRLPRFQVSIRFADAEQFAKPFKEVAAAGIRSGLHGLMMQNVDEFFAEVFEDMS